MLKRNATVMFVLLAFASGMAQRSARPNIAAPNGVEVNVLTGNLFLQRTDMVVPGRGIPTDISFSFNTALDSFDYGFGKGWTFRYNMQYSMQASKTVLLRMDGRQDTFTLIGSVYQSPAGIFDKWEEYQPGKFRLKTKYGMKYFFDDASHKKLTKIEDPNGNALTLTYSGGILASLTNPGGRTLTFTFSNGRLSQITDVSVVPNRQFHYAYDASGRLTCAGDPLGKDVCYAYGDFNQVVRVTDKRGSPVSIEYDAGRRVSRIVSCLGEQRITYIAASTTFQLGLLIPAARYKTFLVEQSNGTTRTTVYSLDIKGRLVALQNPSEHSAVFSYDSNDNMVAFTDFNGLKYLFTYDNMGNVLTKSDPLGKTTTYSYEPNFNQIASVKNRNGHTTTFAYNPSNGNLLSVHAPLGVQETYLYDANGNRTSVTNGLGQTIGYSYAANGDLNSVQFPVGIQTFEYDAAGNLIASTDANGDVVQLAYDVMNRVQSITDPRGHTTAFVYDEAGNLIAETDPNGNPKTYSYDAFGRLISVGIPAGTTHYTYDFFGNLTAITDANGHETRHTYNLQSLVERTTDGAGNQTLYAYDPNGNLLRKTLPNGKIISYSYDALNRLAGQSYPENTDQFTYDAEGNLISAANSVAAIQFAYDALNRLKFKTIVNWGKSVGYTYNAAGDRLTMTDPDGGITSYTYDSNRRLVALTNPQNETTTFLYDPGGRLTRQGNANGTYSTYAYDPAGNLLKLSNLKSNGDTLSFFAYTYDNIGNRLSMTELAGANYYRYDANYRVDSVAYANGDWETFAYDGAGNRIGHTKNGVPAPYSYNAADMIQSGAGATFAFDANGNMISKTDSAGATTYDYDAQNRLWRVTLPGGQTNVFRYDPFGTRISLTDTIGTETRFVHDRDNILLELNGGNATQARYTAGLGVDSWIAMQRGGGSYFYHKDGLNSTAQMTDGGGGVVNAYGYEVFGGIRSQTVNIDNSILFTGREFDKLSDLYYYRFRYYNFQIGRFSKKDNFSGFLKNPLTQNLFIYTEDNPLINTDPYGDVVTSAAGFLVGVGASVISDLIKGEKDIYSYIRHASVAGIAGAVTASTPATWGLFPSAITAALADGTTSAIDQRLDDLTNATSDFSLAEVLSSTIGGGVGHIGGEVFSEVFGDVFSKKAADLFNDANWFLDNMTLKNMKLYIKLSRDRSMKARFFKYGWPDFVNIFVGNTVSGLTTAVGNIAFETFSFSSSEVISIPILRAVDPNDILGPPGLDSLRWVRAHDRLGYTIRFENDPDFATAPAQRAVVELPLGPKFAIQSVRLGNFGFGAFLFSVPPNSAFYTTRLDVRDSLGVFVDVTAGIDVAQNKIFWIFQSIDPATGLPPNNALLGFLPVNDTIQIDSIVQLGEGYVEFNLSPAAATVTGDTLLAQAGIVFDENPSIATNIWNNRVDAFGPTSQITELPPTVNSAFSLHWSGVDDPGGVGIEHYDLYVRRDTGSFYLYKSHLDTTTISFTGIAGSTYYFYTLATDRVGNREAQKLIADDTVTLAEGIRVAARVFLQGPYVAAAQLMHDSLRVQNRIPLTEPYTGLNTFTHTGGGGGETTTPAVLAVFGPDAIVDWVFLELRSATSAAQVVATRAALLQRDGDVVDVDGVSSVVFAPSVNAANYYLTVRHRNHLGVQLGASKFYARGSVVATDFTIVPPEGFYSHNGLSQPQRLVSGKYTLWAGNGRIDPQLKYNGSNNDRTAILSVVGLTSPNAVVPGYRLQDYNLDGVVKYNGAANDRNVLLGNVGITTPSAVVEEQVAR